MTPPVVKRPCQHVPARPESCGCCFKIKVDYRYAAIWEDDPVPSALPIPLPACKHEGQTLEHCPKRDENRHVRDCSHPDNPTERCVRGKMRTLYWQCETCEHHSAKATPEIIAQPEQIQPTQPMSAPVATPKRFQPSFPANRWAYGVTTVPERRKSYLPETLASLRLNGFDAPTLFVDGCTHLEALGYEQEYGLPVVTRYPRIRTYGNWILALGELFVRNPSAERFAIFQDDVAVVRNLRGYLDTVKLEDRTYWNLYCVPSNQKSAPKDHRGFFRTAQRGWGALALVFSRQGVIDLLTEKHTVERPMDAKRGHRSIDGGIVTAMNKAGYSELCHAPSLVTHIGHTSSMGNRWLNPPENWPGEDWDALELVPPAQSTPK